MNEDMKQLFEMLNECIKIENCSLKIDGLSSKVIVDYINTLKQQLKDKDENISKVIEIIRNDTTLNPQRQRDRLINILESNKED